MRGTRRGSRKHILDWTERPDFADQLSQLVRSTGAIVGAKDPRMPRGHSRPEEARLEKFGPQVLPTADWQALQDWWLVHKRRANTPNWDLASKCTIRGQQGLVLIEAKAHVQELKLEGKYLRPDASQHSRENHERIRRAIEEANDALARVVPGVKISRDTHYQLANRVAFSWKVASLGVPVVLVYLGFLGDGGMADVGEPFKDEDHWRQVMRGYTRGHIPEEFWEREICCGEASMHMVMRSLPIQALVPM